MNGSMRMMDWSSFETMESCEKQHIVRRPLMITSRRECGDELKFDQTVLTTSRSSSERASRDWEVINEEMSIRISGSAQACESKALTFWRFIFVPSSAMR